MKTEFSKLRTKVFGIIEGISLVNPEYTELRKLLTIAEQYHSGTRKDGTPEFSHQLEMLALALTFHESLSKPLDVYMAVITHDLLEDYPGSQTMLSTLFPRTDQYSRRLAKFKVNLVNEYTNYFNNLAECEVCSVVKLIDRVHNLSTAPGVFKTEKILEYCDEVDTYFFGMLKTARDNFGQRAVYETLKFMLNTQVHTIRTLLKTEDGNESS